jgi:hypothetical protein
MSYTWIPDSPCQLGSSANRIDFLRLILPGLFKVILKNRLYPPTNTANKERYQRLLDIYQQKQEELERAWNFLSQMQLYEYIWLIGEFPNPLLPTILSGSKHKELLQGLQGTYRGISIGLSCLAQGQPELSNSQLLYIEDLKPLALLAQATLTLARSVISHKQCSNDLKRLFRYSPEYLWFFCQVAICRREMRRVGLVDNPDDPDKLVILTQAQEAIKTQKQKSKNGLLSKQKFLEDWSAAIKQLEDPSDLKKLAENFKDRVDLFEHMDWVLLNEALKIADADGEFDGSSWKTFTRTLHSVRNQFRQSENLQVVYLYTFADYLDEVHLHITGKNQKMPKPPKRPKRGFNKTDKQ